RGIHVVVATRVAGGDAAIGGSDETGQEVGQGFLRRGRLTARRSPRSRRAVERKTTALVAQVVDEQLGAAELATELQVVAAHGVAEVVGNVVGGVRAAQGCRFAHAAMR